MKAKKIIVLLLCFVLTLSFAACGKDDHGQRGDVDTDKSGNDKQAVKEKDDSVLGDYIFDKMENDTGVYYDLLKDGYGHIAIPYPEESEVTREASNQIKIFNPQMNTTFLIEYIFTEPETEVADVEPMSSKHLIDMFNWQLQEQTFQIDNIIYQRSVDQYSSKDPGLKEINTDQQTLLRFDFKELHTTSSDGDNDFRIACERRYYIRNGNMCACISAISEQIDYKYTKEMIDYMVSNIRVYDEDLERSTFPVKIGSDTLDLSSLFSKSIPADLQYINADGNIYQVADNEGSTMSGAFFSVMNINKGNYVFDESTIDNNEIFLLAYPDVASVTENNDMPSQYDKDNEQISALYPLKQYLSQKQYKISDLFGSNLSIYRVERGGSYFIEHGDMWTIDEFIATKDNKSYLITYGYPTPKHEDAIKVINNMIK